MAFFDEFTKKAKDVAYLAADKAKDAAELTKPPFDKPVSFIKLFDANTRSALLAAINQIRENAVQIAAS